MLFMSSCSLAVIVADISVAIEQRSNDSSRAARICVHRSLIGLTLSIPKLRDPIGNSDISFVTSSKFDYRFA
jgi:hypothetical protein